MFCPPCRCLMENQLLSLASPVFPPLLPTHNVKQRAVWTQMHYMNCHPAHLRHFFPPLVYALPPLRFHEHSLLSSPSRPFCLESLSSWLYLQIPTHPSDFSQNAFSYKSLSNAPDRDRRCCAFSLCFQGPLHFIALDTFFSFNCVSLKLVNILRPKTMSLSLCSLSACNSAG